MKWYRSNIDKSIKRTKYGFYNPLLPYIEDRLSIEMNKTLNIVGFGDDFISSNYLRPPPYIINYNMFDENFLLDNFNKFNDIISYNIITNEVLLNNNELLNIYIEKDSNNLLRYCHELISCLQYDRRISSIISGIIILIS